MQSRVLAILVAIVLALVATAALVIYVNGADRRAISDQQPVVVLVAKSKIATGTRGEDAQNNGLLESAQIPRKLVARDALRSVEQLAGRFAAVDIVPGEQLLSTRWVGAGQASGRRLLAIPTDHQAIAIELDLTRQVAGFVTPGDHVSMVVSMKRTPKGGSEAVDTSEFMLQDVQVLAVGATAQANTSSQGGGGRVAQGRGNQNLTAITLAVPKEEVEAVVFGAENGSVYLSLLPPGQKKIDSTPQTADNSFPR